MDYNPRMLEEIQELRKENAKTYKTLDGKQKLVAYVEPIHYEKDGQLYDIDTTIQNEEVENAPYKGVLLKDKIGASITKEDEGEITVEVAEIGWVPTGYKDPLFDGSKALYEDVVKDVDIVINFNDNGSNIWRVLKSPEAEKTIIWKITQDETLKEMGVNPVFYGHDSEGRPVQLKTEIIDKLVENGKKIYYIKDVFTGKTLTVDEKTRVRSLSDEVTYPVMIDPEIRIKGLLKLEPQLYQGTTMEMIKCQV